MHAFGLTNNLSLHEDVCQFKNVRVKFKECLIEVKEQSSGLITERSVRHTAN